MRAWPNGNSFRQSWKRSVLDFHAPEQRRPFDNQPLGGRNGMAPVLADTSKDSDPAIHDFPVFGHADFGSAENRVGVHHGLSALDLCVPQVNFAAAKYCGASGAVEILCSDPPLDAAKHCNFS